MADHIRRRRIVAIDAVGDMEALNVLIDNISSEHRASAQEELRRLAEAIDRLPPKCRETVWLRRVDDLPQKEVAARLGISEKTVEKHIMKGMKLLANAMSECEAGSRERPGSAAEQFSTRVEDLTCEVLNLPWKAITTSKIRPPPFSRSATVAIGRDQDQARLEEWLSESTARRVAFLRLEASWDEARRLKVLGAGLPPGAVPPPGEWRHTPFFDSESATRRDTAARSRGDSPTVSRTQSLASARPIPGAVAATVLLWPSGAATSTRPDPSGRPLQHSHRRASATVPLADGSHITLNTGNPGPCRTHPDRSVGSDSTKAKPSSKSPTTPLDPSSCRWATSASSRWAQSSPCDATGTISASSSRKAKSVSRVARRTGQRSATRLAARERQARAGSE